MIKIMDNVSMKFAKQLSIISTSALLTSQLLAADAKDAAPSTEAKDNSVEVENQTTGTKEMAQVEPTPEQISSYFETLGWMTIMQSGLKNLGTDAKENEAFLKGVRSAVEGKEAPYKLGDIMQPMQNFLQKRASDFEKKHQEELKVIAEKNRKAGDDFMKDLVKKNPAIKTTASGLSYEIIAEGDTKIKANSEDSVEIYYTGKLIDGKVFDESKAKPITFPLNGVVPGIKEGLQLIGQGGKIVLYITDNLAYGEYDIPSIPAGSRLIFDVEIVKVNKSEKEIVEQNKSEKEIADNKVRTR